MAHGTLAALRHTGVGIVLFAMAGTAAAAVSDGRWKGVIKAGTDMVRTSAMLSGDAMHLKFGEPHNCQIRAELLEQEGEESHFRFKPSANGGAFCTGLYPGSMLATGASGGVNLSFQRAGRSWSGLLSTETTP